MPSLVLAMGVILAVTLFATGVEAQYTVKNLVSSTDLYRHRNLDPNLIDGWGLAALPGSPWWLSAQNTSTSPLYSAKGTIVPLLVDIPCVTDNRGTTTVPCPLPGEGYLFEPNNPNNPKFGLFGPTGIVANAYSQAFEVNGASALFIFATLDGLIVAWNTSVSPVTESIVVANRFGAAAYFGLAIAGPAQNPHLYAANIVGGIDVFDKNFNFVNTFLPEPNLATTNPGFKGALYGVQAIGDKLYATYLSDAVAGGILDVCDLENSTTNPTCSRLFASNLNGTEKSPVLFAPWGIALAPHNFGPLSNRLLVGNVGDGLIHAFDPDTGQLKGTLKLCNGAPISIPGLWGLQFGLGDRQNGPRNHLFFSAGPSPVSVTDAVQLYGAGIFGVIKPKD
ncbi:MAG: TIGR03118 family protein [Deltaproteobacteria bacterium]|nr:TIGR03118 family protein [Deltaproteobacteria bacterium]